MNQTRNYIRKSKKLKWIIDQKTIQVAQPQRKLPEIIPAVSNIVQTKRIFWYNDPHILSEAIMKLIKSKKQNSKVELVDLLTRHTGAANSQVFGVAFKELTNLKEYELVLRLHELMMSRNIKPTQQGYTSLLTCFVHTGTFEEALSFFKEMELSIQHVNVLLKVCASKQKFDFGMALFQSLQHMNPSNSDFTVPNYVEEQIKPFLKGLNTLKPDAHTFAELFQLLSQKKQRSNLNIATTNFQKAEEMANLDELCIGAYLNVLLQNQEPDIETEVLRVVKQHLGLPIKLDERITKKPVISPQIMVVLLRLATKMNHPKLGKHWYESSCQRSLESDEPVQMALCK